MIRPLECWSPASCLVAGSIDPDRVGQDVKTYDGLAWSAMTVADPTDLGNISAVSCATTTFCAAVDDQGYVMVRHGATWSYPEALEPQVELGQRRSHLPLERKTVEEAAWQPRGHRSDHLCQRDLLSGLHRWRCAHVERDRLVERSQARRRHVHGIRCLLCRAW